MRVARIAARQESVVSSEQLRACGLNRQAVLVRRRNGHLHRIHRGVYAVGHQALTMRGRLWAAQLACGNTAVLSHFSAAAVWCLLAWDDRLPELTVVGSAPRRHPGLHVHRARTLDPRDVTRHHGVRVTTPARTLLDLADVLDHHALRRAVREAQAQRRTSLPQLVDVIERANGRPAAAKLAAIVAAGPAPTRSELEDRVLELLERGEIARPEVNAVLNLAGRRIIPDFLWRDRRLIVEADGLTWHDGSVAREDDADRQAILEAHGYRVLRVTWDQTIRHERPTLTRIRAALGSGPARR